MSQQLLAGKSVLFIAPRFFGYEEDIARYLEQQGATVDFIPDRPFESPFMIAVTRFARPLMIGAATAVHRRRLAAAGRGHYDLILVNNGQTVSKDFLRELRSSFPRARVVLYLYDSLANRSSVAGNLELFDECFSFDPADCQRYGMRFRPLFFSAGFECRPPAEDIGVSFIGTAHTDRYPIVARLRAGLPAATADTAFWYLYLQAPWVYHVYRRTNPGFADARMADFRFAPLAKAEVQQVFTRSRSVLDIEHPRQSGLTMRTFETMGARKKLITTNHRIRDYDFFDERNVCVIDRSRPVVPAEFFDTPYTDIAPELFAKYRLEGWAREVLGLPAEGVR